MPTTDALNPNHLFGHVQDADHFDVPRFLSPHGDGRIDLPQPLAKIKQDAKGNPIRDAEGHLKYETVWAPKTGSAMLDEIIQPMDHRLTKFMVIESVVALIMCAVFILLARRLRGGQQPKGRLSNMLEAMLVYLRDNVARPAIGSHDGDRFVPLVWTAFFFVLGCNLMGMVPWMGSPTGAFAVTAALAFVTFITVIGSGMVKLGPVGFWKAQVPHLDLSFGMKLILVPLIFVIEVMGMLIKHFVLSVRLLANMMGGHVVLAVVLAFIAATWGSVLFWGVMPVSVLGAVALNILELLVAFIQAYIFAFLTALFIGMAVHPH